MIMTNGFYLNQTLAEELVDIGVSSLYITAYTKEEKERFKLISISIPIYIQSGELDNRLNLYEKNAINGHIKRCFPPCYAPLNEIIITRDAKVGLCCLDWKRQYCFGDLKEKNIDEIIIESNMYQIYESLSSGQRVFDICKVCGWSR